MSFPLNELIPDDPDALPPARRRRAHRLLVPLDGDEQAAFLSHLTLSAAPSLDFFLFSLTSGLIFGLGLLVDQPGFLLLAAVIAPVLSPVIGMALGTAIGSASYFARQAFAFFIGAFFAFTGGLVAGVVVPYWFPAADTFELQSRFHARLSWVYAMVLVYGAVMTTLYLARQAENSRASSAALAYGLYLPLVVAGFGLSSGLPFLFPDGLVVFVIHLVIAVLLATVTLVILGYRPLTLFGFTFGGAIALVGLLLLVGLSSAGIAVGGQVGIPTYTPSPTLTPSLTPTLTPTPIPPTLTPVPPTATFTPTPVPPTSTFTLTPVPPTPTPTPVYAVVFVTEDTGARIRIAPRGTTITILDNGTTVRLLEKPQEFEGEIWMHVITKDGIEGWMLGKVLKIATPVPSWSP